MKLAIDFGPLESIASKNFAGQPVGSVISGLLKIIFPIAGFLLLLYLLYGGFQLMTSGGDPKAIQDAKSKITYALVGFLIVFTAFWLAQFFGLILGIPDVYRLFGV